MQLQGHREGGEQGHQARLLHRPAAATEMDRDAGLIRGFTGAAVDMHEYLANRAAEGGGGHGLGWIRECCRLLKVLISGVAG
jgi:hypothetical protein